MKEQNKKFSNKFPSSNNKLNERQLNKASTNNSELEKIISSNKNDLSRKIDNKNQKEINNGNIYEERPKSPSSKLSNLNSNNLNREEIKENNIRNTNNTDFSKEKKIYFYFKQNFQNPPISNRGNYSPPASSRKREVIFDSSKSDILELDRNTNNKNNFFSVSIDTEIHQDIRNENFMKNKKRFNNLNNNNQEIKNVTPIKLNNKIFINKEKNDYIDKIMKTTNSLTYKENDIKLNTDGKTKKPEMNKIKNISKLDNDKMKKPLKENLAKKSKRIRFGNKRMLNSPKNDKDKNRYINKNEKLYLNTFSNQFNIIFNEPKDKGIIKKGLNINSIIKAKKIENKINSNNQIKRVSNNKEKIKNNKIEKNNNKSVINKVEAKNFDNSNKINENNTQNLKGIEKKEININNKEDKLFIKKEIEFIKRNEQINNIKKEGDNNDNINNIIVENSDNQNIVKNIIIKRDLSNRNNNAVYISKNSSTKHSSSVNKIVQNDTNNNTIYISNYFGYNKNNNINNNMNNNMNNNINMYFRKNSETLISSKINIKNENENNNDFSKNNNPINKIYNTDSKNNNNKGKYFFTSINDNNIEKINLNLDNEKYKNYTENKEINIEENKEKQIFKNNLNYKAENKNINKKYINNEDIQNKILFQNPNNIININIKVNPKIGLLNNSQKINDFKSYSNMKSISKDYSKIIDIIKDNNNGTQYKMNRNNKINRQVINNKENNNVINIKHLNRNNSDFILFNKNNYNKNKMTNSSSSSNIINSYNNNKNQNNLSQFSNYTKKPSKIIIQNVVIENNAINNNIFFSNSNVPSNNYLINSFRPPFGIQNYEENSLNNLNNESYIPNLRQSTEITRNIIYPIKENKNFNKYMDNFNYAEREPKVNLKAQNKETDKKLKIINDASQSRNHIKPSNLLRHSNSDFVSNSVEKLISSDETSSSKLIVINSSIKEKRMNDLKGRSRSLLSNRPKAKCFICNKLIETHLLQIHINAHPSEVFKWLFLGTFSNACDKEELRRINIKYILNCAIECKNNTLPKDIKELHLKIRDDKNFDIIPFFQEANDFINQARLDGGKILIHCKLGISRSAAIIIAYLIKYYGLNFNSALKFIKKQRDRINPNKGFMEQLKKYENMVQTKIKRK